MTMKTIYTTLILGLFLIPFAKSQEINSFSFNNNVKLLDVSQINPADVKSHKLGDDIAKKMVLLDDAYTKIEKAGPTSPVDKTIIRKPVIYNSIKKLNKYYLKGVKKSEIDTATAYEQFIHCLDVAIIIAHQNTSAFEENLKKIKDPQQIYSTYKSVDLE